MSQAPDPFEFLKSLWAPMGLPMAGVMAPIADDVEKRIAELKLVENWLNMNLNVLRMTIQALELQKSGLEAMQGAATAPAQAKAQEGQESGERPPEK